MSTSNAATKPKPRPKPAAQQGVTVTTRGSSPTLYLRYKDPNTGADTRECLHTTNRVIADKAAIIKAAKLRHERDELVLRRSRGDVAEQRYEIHAEALRYFQALAKAPGRSTYTLRNIEDVLHGFATWCHRNDLRFLDQLDGAKLTHYHDHVCAKRKLNGQFYKASTTNQTFKYVRAMLRTVAGTRAPHLSTEVLRQAMPLAKLSADDDNELHQIKRANPLQPNEIPLVISCALQYAEAHPRAPLFAADLVTLLLNGFRRAEYVGLLCGNVRRHPEEWLEIHVPASIAKGRRKRDVFARGFTVLGVELALAMAEGRANDEPLSYCSYDALDSTMRLIRKAHPRMPAFCLHDLRATCASYQLALEGVDLKRATARLGHTLSVADRSYYAPPKGLDFQARSLEAAMRCQPEIERVIGLVRARPDAVRYGGTQPELLVRGVLELPRKRMAPDAY